MICQSRDSDGNQCFLENNHPDKIHSTVHTLITESSTGCFWVDSPEDARNWPEDYEHENGDYSCICLECREEFVGHKRRIVCRKCATMTPEEKAKIAEKKSEADYIKNQTEFQNRMFEMSKLDTTMFVGSEIRQLVGYCRFLAKKAGIKSE